MGSTYFIKYLKIFSTEFERGCWVASHVGDNRVVIERGCFKCCERFTN